MRSVWNQQAIELPLKDDTVLHRRRIDSSSGVRLSIPEPDAILGAIGFSECILIFARC